MTIHSPPPVLPPVELPPVELLVCLTCRNAAIAPGDDDRREGDRLHAALSAAELPEGVTLHPVECLSNCDHGCSIALRGGPGRWTYVYGNLSAEDAGMILDGVTRYLAAHDGLVPWRERPQHFRKNCIARIPPQEATTHA